MTAARLTWVGHSTVLVDLDGVRLLTDPLLRTRVAHLRRVAAVDPRSVRGIDAVLVSHVHYDHLDLPSLERLGKALPVIVPVGAGTMLRRRRFGHVVELAVGEDVAVGPLRVRATHAEHEAGRGPLRARAPSLGFVVEGTRRVYFAGDTDVFDAMAGLAEPTLDVALVPIWGWGPSVGPGHMDPERAAQALALIRPRLAVPIHFGTYYPLTTVGGQPSFLTEPVVEFERLAAALAPEVEIRILPLGGSLELD